MDNIQIFKNKEFGDIRALEINGQPWLIGKDITEILGYSNSRKSIIDHVEAEDKGVTKCDTLGGKQDLTIINESGLYSLIFGSKLPTAKKFKKWVTSEVLPQIRKTGGYIQVDQSDDEASIMAKALMIAQNTLAKKDELLKKTSKELENKNNFIKQISVSENSLLVREVAKVVSKEGIIIGERRLWDKLREWGLIFKKSTEPKQEYIDRGYFEVSEGTKENSSGVFTYHTTRVTGKGQVYIIERLLKERLVA